MQPPTPGPNSLSRNSGAPTDSGSRASPATGGSPAGSAPGIAGKPSPPPEPEDWGLALEQALEKLPETLARLGRHPRFWPGVGMALFALGGVLLLLQLGSGVLALIGGLLPTDPPLNGATLLAVVHRLLNGETPIFPLSWRQAGENALGVLLLAASLPDWPLVLYLRRDPVLKQWPARLEPLVRLALLLLRTAHRCLRWPWQALLALIRLGEAVIVAINLALIGAVAAFFAGWIPDVWISETLLRLGDRFLPLIQRLLTKAGSGNLPGIH